MIPWSQKRHREERSSSKDSHKKIKATDSWSDYGRTTVPLETEHQDLDFFLLEVDDAAKDKTAILPPSFERNDTCIRLFGVTNNQQSLLVFVQNFHQYLYFPVTPQFTNDDCLRISQLLKEELRDKVDLVGDVILLKDKKPLMCKYE